MTDVAETTGVIERALSRSPDTREIEFGAGVIEQTGALFAKLFPGKSAQVIADGNTFAVAGATTLATLQHAGVNVLEPYVFPARPTLYGEYGNVVKVREILARDPEAVACSIGSGTINDLAKLASGELGRPYMNVCTAASVDGYASFGASISRDGFKITRACPGPAGLIADTAIMATAPQRLTATGYGDLFEKIPAGADWMLADELDIEGIDADVWDLVQGNVHAALADPAGVRQNSAAAVGALAEGNILSGLAMQVAQSSRPASGAGHQFSHVWEMEGHGLDWEPPLSHGFKVAVGTVAALALWQEALSRDFARIDVDRVINRAPTDLEVEARVRMMHWPRVAEAAVPHTVEKNLQDGALRQRLERIQQAWPKIRDRCAVQLMTPDEAAENLSAAGAPCHPETIKIGWDRFRLTHFQAQMIRPRYTVLDLLVDTGALTDVVNHLFSPEGYWGAHRHAS